MIHYNDVNTREKNIKIFVRVLPLEKPCDSCVRVDLEYKKIFIRCLQEMQPNRVAIIKEPSYWCFKTDGIFLDASQEEVYHSSSKDLVLKILDGTSCVLLGHGQTGSGKSFTLSGLSNNWEHRGLVSRILCDLFLEKSNRKRVSKIQYHISFVELRGKDVRDLLLPETENKARIKDRDPFKEISVVPAENEGQALRMIFEGEVRRSIVRGSTYSVSHVDTAVITIHATNASLVTSGSVFTRAKMHIVEMAGIGTMGRNDFCKTASDIATANSTKSQLEHFFAHLGNGGPMPYNVIRSSNLLKILGNDFPVASVIRFISHIRVTREDLDVTLSTLRFSGNIARLKPTKVKKGMEYGQDRIVERLRNEIDALKKELTINEMLLNQEASINISRTRLEQIKRSVVNYLNGNVNKFTLLNMTQAQQLLKSVKDLYNRLTAKETEMEQLKEMYENMSKNMVDVGVSARLSKESLTAESRIHSLKKDTLEVQEEASKVEEVGSIAKIAVGMTLGPYQNEEEGYERDNVTAVEHERQMDHQSILMKLRQIFKRFLKDERVYSRMKEKLDKNVRTLEIVQQRFSKWIDKYFEVKSTLENAKDKLSKHQRIRYAMKPQEPEELVPEVEIVISRDIACHQRVLMNLEEEVLQAQNEIRHLLKEQLKMHTEFKSGFREYCKEMDALTLYSDNSIKLLLEPVEKESLEVAKSKFNQFQRAMMRKFEEKERMKEVRRDDWCIF
ncbi:kinesin-like protein KIF9 [Megalopta genalis]|uniref:kinesin-like protein KIF9 n=1 Tax=Megalopta genalis TaxID=115081 RepID=UPI003FD31375